MKIIPVTNTMWQLSTPQQISDKAQHMYTPIQTLTDTRTKKIWNNYIPSKTDLIRTGRREKLTKIISKWHESTKPFGILVDTRAEHRTFKDDNAMFMAVCNIVGMKPVSYKSGSYIDGSKAAYYPCNIWWNPCISGIFMWKIGAMSPFYNYRDEIIWTEVDKPSPLL